MLWRAVLIVLPAAMLAGCGQSTIKPSGAEQAVVDVVFGQTGSRPVEVRCHSGGAAEAGVSFECRFTGPDDARIRITEVQG